MTDSMQASSSESAQARMPMPVMKRALLCIAIALLLAAPSTFFRHRALMSRGGPGVKAESGSPPLEVMANMMGGLKGMMVNILWLMAINAEEKGRLHEVNTYYELITSLQPRFVQAWESWGQILRAMANSAPNHSMRWFWLRSCLEVHRSGEKYTSKSATLFKSEAFIYRFDFGYDKRNAKPLRQLLFDDDELTQLIRDRGIEDYSVDTAVEWLALDRINQILGDPDHPNRPPKQNRLNYLYERRAQTRVQIIAGNYYRSSMRHRSIIGANLVGEESGMPDGALQPPGWVDLETIAGMPPDRLGFFDAELGEKVQILRGLTDYDGFYNDPKTFYKSIGITRADKQNYVQHFIYLERKWAVQDASYGLTQGLAAEFTSDKQLATLLNKASDFYYRRSKARSEFVHELFTKMLKEWPPDFPDGIESEKLRIEWLCREYDIRRKKAFQKIHQYDEDVPDFLEDLDWRVISPEEAQ